MAEEAKSATQGRVITYSAILPLLLGCLLVIAGMILVIVTSVFQTNEPASFGAVIFIGPVPIVIGTGPEAAFMIVISIALTAISLIMLIMICRKKRVSD
ncbi:MAG: DUF131 domain-containing protein [Candidatus Bathyarchaeia archaeon]